MVWGKPPEALDSPSVGRHCLAQHQVWGLLPLFSADQKLSGGRADQLDQQHKANNLQHEAPYSWPYPGLGEAWARAGENS